SPAATITSAVTGVRSTCRVIGRSLGLRSDRTSSMNGLCAGRVCVVTGAGRGIGRAHVEALARAGARVVVNDLASGGEDPAQAAVDDMCCCGGAAIVHHGDVSMPEVAEELVEAALREWGRLDVLVNNAGILRDRALVNMTDQDFDDVLRIHLRGTF